MSSGVPPNEIRGFGWRIKFKNFHNRGLTDLRIMLCAAGGCPSFLTRATSVNAAAAPKIALNDGAKKLHRMFKNPPWGRVSKKSHMQHHCKEIYPKILSYREKLYCTSPEALQHVCNFTVLTWYRFSYDVRGEEVKNIFMVQKFWGVSSVLSQNSILQLHY